MIMLLTAICGFMLFGLVMILCEVYGSSNNTYHKCRKCKTWSSHLTQSHEVVGMKICHECAWEEHSREFDAPWATVGHT